MDIGRVWDLRMTGGFTASNDSLGEECDCDCASNVSDGDCVDGVLSDKCDVCN